MGLEGQIGAGVGFLGIGLLQGFAVVKAYRLNDSLSGGGVGARKNRGSSKGGRSFRAVELAAIACLAVMHMIFGLLSSHNDEVGGSGVGMAVCLERFGVATVFLLYAMVALISEGTTILPLPSGTLELIAVFAFGEEFLLFYSSRGGDTDAGLEVQYYTLLLVPIGVCLLATSIEIAYPTAILPPFVRSMALILQGTWFFQMGVSLFTTKWMAQGCELVQRGEGDFTIQCQGMSLMRGKALATLQFNCHLALLLLFLVPLYGLMSKIYTAPSTYERLGEEHDATDEARGALQVKDNRGQEMTQSEYFHVLEDDEEEELETPAAKDAPDTNGFHRVSI